MTVLDISCMNLFNVLGGFFITRRRLETSRVPAKLGMTSHVAEAEAYRMRRPGDWCRGVWDGESG